MSHCVGWPGNQSRKFLEPMRRQCGIARRILNVAMPEIGLDGPGVLAVVGELALMSLALASLKLTRSATPCAVACRFVHRLLDQPRLSAVPRQQFWLGFGNIYKLTFECFSDASVKRTVLLAQQCAIFATHFWYAEMTSRRSSGSMRAERAVRGLLEGRLGYSTRSLRQQGGALPLASLRRAAMALSSFTRYPSAGTR